MNATILTQFQTIDKKNQAFTPQEEEIIARPLINERQCKEGLKRSGAFGDQKY